MLKPLEGSGFKFSNPASEVYLRMRQFVQRLDFLSTHPHGADVWPCMFTRVTRSFFLPYQS